MSTTGSVNSDYDAYVPLLAPGDNSHGSHSDFMVNHDGVWCNSNQCCRRLSPAARRCLLVSGIVTLVLAVVVVVAALVLIFGVAPGIIQSTMSSSSLVVSSISLKPPFTHDSFNLAVQATLLAHSSVNLPWSIDATLMACDVSVLYSPSAAIGAPTYVLGTVPLSQQQIRLESRSSESVVELGIDGTFQITNLSLWDEFSRDLLMSPHVEWQLAIFPFAEVVVIGRTFQVTFSKSIILDGFNGLRDSFVIRSLSMTNSTDEAIIVDLVADVQDPSPALAIQSLGLLELNLVYEEVWVGAMTTLVDISLAPNTTQSVPIRAVIKANDLVLNNGGTDSIAIVKHKLSELLSHIAAFEDFTLTACGSWTPPNAHPLAGAEDFGTTHSSAGSTPPLFVVALRHLRVIATVTPDVLRSSIRPLVEGFAIQSMNVTPASASSVELNEQVTIFANSPLGDVASMDVRSVVFPTQAIKLVINHTDVAGYIDTSPLTQFVQRRRGDRITLNAALNGFLALRSNPRANISESFDYTDTFVNFVQSFSRESHVVVGLRGNGDVSVTITALLPHFEEVYLRGVPIDVWTDLEALHNFNGSRVPDFVLPADAPGGHGEVILLNATFPNPSVVALRLTQSRFNVSFGGSYIGHAVSDGDLAIVPGFNTLSFSGIVDPEDLGAASHFFTNYLLGRDSVLVASGSSVVRRPGEPIIPWVDAVLPALQLSAVVSGIQNFNLISNVSIETLAFRFETREQGAQVPVASGRMGADYSTPPMMAFPFSIVAVNMSIAMTFNGTVIGHLNVPLHAAVSTPTSPGKGHLSVQFADQLLSVDSFPGFESFMTAMFLQPTAAIDLAGVSTAVVHTAMGNVSLVNVPFHALVSMNGVDEFRCYRCVVVSDVDLMGGDPGMAYFTLSLHLTNPSSATMALGRLAMDIRYQGKYIGTGVIPFAVLNVGPNVFTVYATFYQLQDNLPQGRAFLSNFIQGNDVNVTLHGFPNGTDILMAQKGFAMVSSPAIILGYAATTGTGIIHYARLQWSFRILKLIIPVELSIFNPFNASVGITEAYFSVIHKGRVLGIVDVNLQNDPQGPIILPPAQMSVTRPLDAKIQGLSVDYLRTLFGKIHIDVTGHMTILVKSRPTRPSGFLQVIDYNQFHIPASFQRE